MKSNFLSHSHNNSKEKLAIIMKQAVGADFDAVFGSTTAGMSPAENLARVMGIPYFYVRTDAKSKRNNTVGAKFWEVNGRTGKDGK